MGFAHLWSLINQETKRGRVLVVRYIKVISFITKRKYETISFCGGFVFVFDKKQRSGFVFVFLDLWIWISVCGFVDLDLDLCLCLCVDLDL